MFSVKQLRWGVAISLFMAMLAYALNDFTPNWSLPLESLGIFAIVLAVLFQGFLNETLIEKLRESL